MQHPIGNSGAHRPLAGLTVLDFTALVPGPMVGLMLAEAGAEVIKIEPPGGEALRHPPPVWGALAAAFALLNRGKKSVALDLKDPEQRARLRPLIARADILIEGFRPGVMARLGLAWESLRAINGRLIYCAITGYGQTGPKALQPGHDLNYIGDAGLLALNPGPPDRPVLPPVLAADLMGGSTAAMINILMALQHRQRSGEGIYLDIAMTDNLFPLMFWAWGQGLSGAGWPEAGCHLFTGGSPRYGLYPASDGRLVAVAALEDKFWTAFCDAIALDPALRDDSVDPRATAAAIGAVIAGRPSTHWRGVFSAASCCVTVLATLAEAMADPQFAARGLVSGHTRLDAADGPAIPALPMPFAPVFRGAGGVRAAPAAGADNAALTPKETL